jgi:hypothetical protein
VTAPKRARWVCPNCGAGVLAPTRPRRDDVRRYCRACSAQTGRLVERVAPALERQRAVARSSASARTAAARERERAAAVAKHTVDGVDLLAEARRYWRLPTMVDARKRYRPRVTKLPRIEWRRSTTKPYSTGRCSPWKQRIVVTLGTSASEAQATVLHELVHAVMPDYEHHGTLFQSTYRSAEREAFPPTEEVGRADS